MIDTQILFDRHESFKNKWFKLDEQDLFDWLQLYEEMLDAKTEAKSEYIEEKQKLDVDKWIRRIVLKGLTDENGKKLNTEWSCDAIIIQEYQAKDQLLSSLKLKSELLDNKTGVIVEYINIIKMVLKK